MADAPQSELLRKTEQTPQPEYTDTEREYLGNFRKKLQDSRDQREGPWDEFDGMTYTLYCEENRKAANSYIKPRSNETETNFVTGTTRQKLLSLLANILNLDLGPDVQAFDEDNQLVVELGEGLEDVIEQTEELDNDREKKLQRLYTLFEQGTVFVEEVWKVDRRKFKTLEKSLKDYKGEVAGVQWSERMKKVFEGASRNVLKNENVYLGDYRQFSMDLQPHVFTVEHLPYDAAKAIYGEWERWKHVPRNRTDVQQQPDTLYNANWRLTSPATNQVEIIKYQDVWNDEYQIMINGVLMLPVGFPLPWRYQKYNIEKQVLELISAYFALGKSFPSRLRVTQGLIDEMMRLVILKTQQALLPPRANLTGRVVSSKVFYPGKITAGIEPGKLPPLIEAQGMTNAEANVLQMLFRNMDENSVDPSTQGLSTKGDATATEILTVKQQAEKMLGITVYVAALLEEKLAYLRLCNILENWFDPVDQRPDAARQYLVDKYRSAVRMKSIDGVGQGMKIVRVAPKDRTPAADDVYAEEQQLTNSAEMPVRIAYLDPEALKGARYEWFITVTPKQRKTSDLSKALWDQFIQRMKDFPNANWGYLAQRTAEIWEENPSKVLQQASDAGMGPMAAAPGGSPATPPAVPQLKNQASLGKMANTGTL